MYLKEYSRPFPTRERLLQQRLFWNQGVANVLVLADPTSVHIYSGLARPAKDHTDQSALENMLVQPPLALTDYVHLLQSLHHALATGHYYETHQNHFDPRQAVDASLLDSLRDLRNALIQGDDRIDDTQRAHAFVGRVLFLCYLLDREIYSIGKSNGNRTGTTRFTELLEKQPEHKRIDFLYKVFSDLKERFNGNMFDQDLVAERGLIKPSHVNKLLLFLGGHDVKSGQVSFWPYDFRMIPVETISAVYQDFLKTEDPEKQRKRGAFYTPRFLAEMVVDTAVREDPDALDRSFLDPACGSGIFLVILFNRIANRWLLQNSRAHYNTKVNAFQEILSRQIHGVDWEETACRIACFSLYLAYLDFFDPPHIQKYIERTGQPLPKLLDYGNTLDRPAADIAVIYQADFLADETLAEDKFDFIVGNPPWEGRGTKQLAQKFMEKAPQMLRDGGMGCLLLPTKILQNQTDAFQAQWLTLVTLEEVLQLADYSFLLFQNALCPAFICRFKNALPNRNHHVVKFSAPKFNRDGLRRGVIKIDPSSRKWIPLADLLAATQHETAPVVWKRRLWGTPRDQKLLDLLQELPSLKEHVDVLSELRRRRQPQTKRWGIGQGLKPWPRSKTESDREPKPMSWPLDTAFLDAKSWSSDLLVLSDETILLKDHLEKKEYRTDILYSNPPATLFTSPVILVNQGFSKVAFCNFDVLFQHSLQSISGPKKDARLLKFLTAYLRSRLARYFLFHTSANWGSERDKVHLNELLRVPFPLPGSEFVSTEADHIVAHVAKRFGEMETSLKSSLNALKKKIDKNALFDQAEEEALRTWHRKRKTLVDNLQSEFEPLIYQYFGLTDQEIALVEDTIDIFIPSATPTTWRSSRLITLDPLEKSTTSPYAEKGLGAYADTLATTLNSWAKTEGSRHRVRTEGGTDDDTGLAMVTVHITKKEVPFRYKALSSDLSKVLKALRDRVSQGQGTLRYERDILFFQGETIHIVRPNILLNWTRTAALNDAARIYGEIAIARRESR
ncbi:MAG: N-6 DNA methylase [Thermodesulfobacteriota bacterium]|nr:N-6 DNA methylase [Thermodesulfobacteriota bacterium]